jgi:AcrR family transcriptional regulator
MKSSTLKKPRRPADEELWERRREEILDAAAVMFARHGYAGTDTQLLVDKLGVGKGTLYRYFRSKEELFLATVDRAMHIARRAVDDGIQNIEDPLDRIAQAIRVYLGFFAEHADYVELFMQERAQFKDRKKPTYFEHREANVEQWLAMYRSLITQGRVRNMSVERITDVMSDLLYGTMFTNYFTGRQKPFEAQAEDILDIVFHGILSDAERRRHRPK